MPAGVARPRARRAARTLGARPQAPTRQMSPRQAAETRPPALEPAPASLAPFCLTTARRFAYPFAPALARGLDVPLTQITSLVAINQGSGLLSPVLGPAVDRWGPRALMLIGLGGLALGML